RRTPAARRPGGRSGGPRQPAGETRHAGAGRRGTAAMTATKWRRSAAGALWFRAPGAASGPPAPAPHRDAHPAPAERCPVRFNLSEWALRNRSLVLYAMIVVAIGGALSYLQLGRSEDAPFTFKAMVVRTLWPGATAEEVARQVTERIENKLMETGEYEFIRSYSRPGESQVIFMARDSMRSRDVPGLWYEVRKKIGDIRATLPEGVVGPFFNDEFGDTFGN